MTSHVARLYALAVSVLVLFAAWAVVATHPWQTTSHRRPIPASTRSSSASGGSGTSRSPSAGSSPGAGTTTRSPSPGGSARSRTCRSSTKRRWRPRLLRLLSDVLLVPVGSGRDPAPADRHEDLLMERHEFRAMGTEIELMLDLPPGPATSHAFSQAEREFGRIEAALSRFLPDSELSALNRSGAVRRGPTSWPPPSWRSPPASAPAAGSTRLCTTRSSRPATTARSSWFRPTGAKRTATEVISAAGRSRSTASRGRSGSPRRPPRPGGIGKGYAVDRAAERLSRVGPCLVNAGGDVAVRGRRWPVGVETANGFVTLELVRARWRRRAATAGAGAGTARSSTT